MAGERCARIVLHMQRDLRDSRERHERDHCCGDCQAGYPAKAIASPAVESKMTVRAPFCHGPGVPQFRREEDQPKSAAA
jgi:hypothetical protein